MNVTRNNIAVGDSVVFMGGSKAFPQQNRLANSLLKAGQEYVVEFVFMGEDFEQIELVGDDLDTLFIHDMFYKKS